MSQYCRRLSGKIDKNGMANLWDGCTEIRNEGKNSLVEKLQNEWEKFGEVSVVCGMLHR